LGATEKELPSVQGKTPAKTYGHQKKVGQGEKMRVYKQRQSVPTVFNRGDTGVGMTSGADVNFIPLYYHVVNGIRAAHLSGGRGKESKRS